MVTLDLRRTATLTGVVVLAAVLDVAALVAVLFGFAWLGYDLAANDLVIDAVCMVVAIVIPVAVTGRFAMVLSRSPGARNRQP